MLSVVSLLKSCDCTIKWLADRTSCHDREHVFLLFHVQGLALLGVVAIEDKLQEVSSSANRYPTLHHLAVMGTCGFV